MKLYRVFALRFGILFLSFVDQAQQGRLSQYTYLFFNLVEGNFLNWFRV